MQAGGLFYCIARAENLAFGNEKLVRLVFRNPRRYQKVKCKAYDTRMRFTWVPGFE